MLNFEDNTKMSNILFFSVDYMLKSNIFDIVCSPWSLRVRYDLEIEQQQLIVTSTLSLLCHYYVDN